jgi:hypothetical protein
LDKYELQIAFKNGEPRRFDVKPYFGRGIFVCLRDDAVFRRVRVVAGSIDWPGVLGPSYDTLYVNGQPNIAEARGAEQVRAPEAQQVAHW